MPMDRPAKGKGWGDKPPLDAISRVANRLMAEAIDVYKPSLIQSLAELAVRQTQDQGKQTEHRKAKRALKWLRAGGHLAEIR